MQVRPGVDPTACFELPAVLVVAHGIATQSVVHSSPTYVCPMSFSCLKQKYAPLQQVVRLLPSLPRSL